MAMRRTLLPLALAAALLAACGGTSTSSDPSAQPATPVTTSAPAGDTPATTDSGTVASAPATDSTAAPAASAPAASAPEALQFAAPLVGGGTIDFTKYAGKTVAIWFWAPT